MKISICTSGNLREFVAKEITDVQNIKKAITSYRYSLGTFKDNQRCKENFIEASMIGLDFDDGMSIEAAQIAFKQYKHLIAPTKSHQKEKNGVVCDRFRVILFLETPITDNSTFEATWWSLYQAYPKLDRACKDSSRYFEPSNEVYSERLNDGLLISPVTPLSKSEKPKEKLEIPPGQRGTLGKRTLDFLVNGAKPGTRHNEIYAAARDAHQNLYPKEWLIKQLEALVQTSGDPAFTDDHALKTVDAAYGKDPKHDPRIEPNEPNLEEPEARAFSYISLGDVLSMPDKEEDWLVQGLLIKGGMSMIVGAPKIGKTTLVRQLEKAILRGEPFLGRKTQKGPILHYSFDEKARTAKRHYRTLGLNANDPLMLHFGAAGTEKHILEFEEDLVRLKPVLAVVDTLFDMADVEDINSYIPIKKKLTIFGTIAEKTNCHILFIHHQTKPNQNYASGSGISVLGSQAIFASVDACMVFEQVKDSNHRTLAVHGRGIDDFDKTQLVFSKEKQIYVKEDIF